MTITLSLTDDADARRAIFDPLMAFNRVQAPDANHRALNVLLRDSEHDVVGGLWGRTA